MYISGMPGTGKTATVLEVVKELEESSIDGDMPAFQFVHLNGLNLTNPQQVFQVILKVCGVCSVVSDSSMKQEI